jgi:hypothetical protein
MKAFFFSAALIISASVSAIAETSGHPKPDRPELSHPTQEKPERPLHPGNDNAPEKPEKPGVKPHKPEPTIVHKPVQNTNNNQAIVGANSTSTSTASSSQQQAQKQVTKVRVDNRTSSLSSLHLEVNPVYSTLGTVGATAVPIFNINGGAANDGWGGDTAWFGTVGIQIPVNNGGDRQAIKLHKCIQILKEAREIALDLDVSAVKVCKSLKFKQQQATSTQTNATPENTQFVPGQLKTVTPIVPSPVPALW